MVEQTLQLDNIFGALADGTRRDILRRVSKNALSIGELARSYNMSFAAIAKHVSKLEKAQLVTKQRQGKQQIVTVVPSTIEIASEHLERYEQLWQERFDALEELLQSK